MTLAGRSALVTGAGRGLGAAIARALAGAGAAVLLADIDGAAAATQAASITAAGGAARAVALDVTREADWRAALAGLERLDVLVNNAGIILRGSLEAMPPPDWERTLAVNLTGAFLGMQACLSRLRGSAGASIVNVSSTAGLIAHPDPAYTASKWGLRGLTKSAALEFAPLGIRVNSIHPATIATGFAAGAPGVVAANRLAIPLGREATAEEVAEVVLFLAGDAARFVTGAEIAVDGGLSHGGVAQLRNRLIAETQQGGNFP